MKISIAAVTAALLALWVCTTSRELWVLITDQIYTAEGQPWNGRVIAMRLNSSEVVTAGVKDGELSISLLEEACYAVVFIDLEQDRARKIEPELWRAQAGDRLIVDINAVDLTECGGMK